MTDGCSCVLLVQFGHVTRLFLVKILATLDQLRFLFPFLHLLYKWFPFVW